MKLGAKELFLDIENSLNIYAAYPSNKPQYLRPENLLQDWFIICLAWKWGEHGKVHDVSLLDDPKRFKKDHTDDYHVVKTVRDVLAECDMVCGHNLKKFDFRKITARIAFHGLEPLPPIKIVDTLKEAKRHDFSHNGLDFLTSKFGFDRKLSHDKNMWLRILKGEEKAIKEAVKYCRGDIPGLVKLYYKLRPYMPNSSVQNANLWRADGIECCPKCSSDDIMKRGTRPTLTGRYNRYQCNECGSWMQGNKAVKRTGIK